MGWEKILVADTDEDKLILIDTESFSVEKTLKLSKLKIKDNFKLNLENNKFGPYDVIKSKDNNIYVTNCYDNSIMKIDLNGEKILGLLKLGKNPTCLRRFDGKIYIANSDSNTISVVDESSFSLLEDIAVEERPTDIRIDRDNKRIFVANGNCYTISIIDLNNKKIKSIILQTYPIKLIYEDERLFVLSYTNKGDKDYTNLSEIEMKNFKIIVSIDLIGIFTDFIKIKGKEMYYLTNIEDGNIYRIWIDSNLKERSVDKSKILLGGMPNKIIFDHKSNLYACNMLSGELISIDEKTGEIKDKIRVGKEPNGLILL